MTQLNRLFVHKEKMTFLVMGLSLVIAMVIQQNQTQRVLKAQNLSSGVDTCFTRVTQSFTALMITDISSHYLTSEFSQLTGECFAAVSKESQLIFKNSNKNLLSLVNQLQNDVHWFLQRMQKSARLSSGLGSDITESNIGSKFSELEEIKSKVKNEILANVQTLDKSINVLMYLGILSFILLLGFLGFSLNKFLGLKKSLKELNMKASHNIGSEGEIPLSAQLDRMLEKLTSLTGTNHIYELYSKYNEELLGRIYQTKDEAPKVFEETQTEIVTPTVRLDLGFSSILKAIQKKAFTHGVLIDADLDEEILIKGPQDVFEQIIFNVMVYAIDSSMLHNEGRKIVVRSKVLAENVYLKLFVSNHFLSAHELELLNDSAQPGDLPVTLEVIRALSSDIPMELEARNKVDKEGNLTGSEFEFLFEAMPMTKEQITKVQENSARLVSFVKGTKRDLLKNFRLDT